MRLTCHLPNQKSVRSCLQVNPLLLRNKRVVNREQLTRFYSLVSTLQPFTRNLHGLDSHGSGVLFKPTRGPFVTRELGTLIPASIHKPPLASVKSTPFSLFVIPMA